MKRLLYVLIFLFIAACAAISMASAHPDDQQDSPHLTPTPAATTPAILPSLTWTPTPFPTCTPMWHLYSAPNPGPQGGSLDDISVISSSDIWAIGNYQSQYYYKMLAIHWNGTQWSIVPTPDLLFNYAIYAVSAVSSNDVWAVGTSSTFSPAPLMMHWDGTTWTSVRINDSPGGGVLGTLYSVSARASNDVWAVGTQGFGASGSLTMHWDGTGWSVIPNPNPPPNELMLLSGVAAVAANDVWAVGQASNYSVPGLRSIIMHWDGVAWSFYNLGTSSNYETLNGISAGSKNDIWAVGAQWLIEGATSQWPLTMHWNGSTWSRMPTPDTGTDSNLADVSVLPSGEAWAVGAHYTGYTGGNPLFRTLIEKWDGTAWSIVPSPNAGGPSTALSAVASASTNEAWAVGNYRMFTGPSYPLVLHYSVECITPTVTATPCPMSFTDVHPADYFYNAAQHLYCMGAISGYADNTFRPLNDTTRGQLTKIIVLAEGWAMNTQGGPHFSDVPETNPFYAFVETAYNRGIISGYADNTFRWGANVTRGQVCKIIVLAEGWFLDAEGTHFSDVPFTQPFYLYIETAYSWNTISGYSDGTFRPNSNATRGQISKIVYSAITGP